MRSFFGVVILCAFIMSLSACSSATPTPTSMPDLRPSIAVSKNEAGVSHILSANSWTRVQEVSITTSGPGWVHLVATGGEQLTTESLLKSGRLPANIGISSGISPRPDMVSSYWLYWKWLDEYDYEVVVPAYAVSYAHQVPEAGTYTYYLVGMAEGDPFWREEKPPLITPGTFAATFVPNAD